MRSKRTHGCNTCGPFKDMTTMLEFSDSDGDLHTMCVDCLMGVFEAIEMPPDAMNAFAAAWTSAVLDTDVSVVTDG